MSSDHAALGGAMDVSVVSLGDYLMRPIRIDKFSWSNEEMGRFKTLNPWALFLENSHVKSKLRDFKYVRGDLNVKFVVNASKFHYGKLAVAYSPLHNYSGLPHIPNFVTESQMPLISLNPSKNESQEMTLPFFSQLNWIDWKQARTYDLGELLLYVVNPLMQANSATPDDPDAINVSVFAWMSNPVIKLPTQMGLQEQAGGSNVKNAQRLPRNPTGRRAITGRSDPGPVQSAASSASNAASTVQKHAKKAVETGNSIAARWDRATGDEYGQGAISKPASTVASWGESISSWGIPVVSEFAKATEVAANVGGRIASFFGFSRPTNVDNPSVFKPLGYSSLANVVGEDNAVKLTLDPKQEIPIGTSNFGLQGPGESMTFNQMFERESFIGKMSWENSQATDTLLAEIPVNPGIRPFNGSGWASSPDGAEFYNTMLGWTTMPFALWTGSMRFRFETICSQFHRGRFQIVYVTEQGETPTYHTNYNTIIDITDTTEIVIKVGWNRMEPWLAIDHHNIVYPNLSDNGAFPDSNIQNGFLQVRVVNPLSGPDVAAHGEINVYCCGSDDFEVALPTDPHIASGATGELQPGETMVSPTTSTRPIHPLPQGGFLNDTPEEIGATQSLELAPSLASRPHDASLHFGERFGSLRAFLKRYILAGYHTIDSEGVGYSRLTTGIILPNRPEMYGFGGTVGQSSGTKQGYHTLLAHYRTCFIAETGGIRYKIIPDMSGSENSEVDTQTHYITQLTTLEPDTGGSFPPFDQLKDDGQGYHGQYWQPSRLNPAIEAEVPYYNKYNFALARSGGMSGMYPDPADSTDDNTVFRRNLSVMMFTGTSNGDKLPGFTVANAAAEDYSLHWLHSAPVTFIYG